MKMVKKVYKHLTADQKKRDVVFSSTLSTQRFETQDATVHEIVKGDPEADIKRERLLDDKFFNRSQYKYNIVRTPDYKKKKMERM